MEQILQKFAKGTADGERSTLYKTHSDKMEMQNLKIIYVNPENGF